MLTLNVLKTTGTWDNHLRQLDIVLHCIAKAGIKVNATKSAFGKPQVEYLGFFITRDGIKPLAKKVEALHGIAPPTPREQLHRFFGIINYYVANARLTHCIMLVYC